MDPVHELPPPLPEEVPPPAPPPEKPYPGFWQAIGLFVVYLLGTAIVVIPFAVADAISKTTLTKSPWVLGVATLAGALLNTTT